MPSLFNSSEDLFAAVDLTQWLTLSPDFTSQQTFEFTDGLSDQLPGFLLARANADGTSPIVFDPTAGFTVAGNFKFSGIVNVVGTIDGQQEVVPEPASFALLLSGFAMAWCWRKRRDVFQHDVFACEP